MAKKKGTKALDVQIKELEAAIGEIHACPSCGKGVEPDAATCPHCGSSLVEGADLQAEEAAKSLQDLEKHLEATEEAAPESPSPLTAPAQEPEPAGLGTAAEVAAAVEPEPEAEEAAAEPAPAPDVGESPDLQGFIEEIEAEVGTPPADSPKTARVHAVPRAEVPRRRSGWLAPVAGGAALYFVALLAALAVLPDLGKLTTASVMILASVLVAVGINLRSGGSSPPARKRAVRIEGAPDYVCPLCGTGIPAHASECPTCGALFED